MNGTIETWLGRTKRHELIGKARKTTEDGDTCEHGKVKPGLFFRRPRQVLDKFKFKYNFEDATSVTSALSTHPCACAIFVDRLATLMFVALA